MFDEDYITALGATPTAVWELKSTMVAALPYHHDVILFPMRQ